MDTFQKDCTLVCHLSLLGKSIPIKNYPLVFLCNYAALPKKPMSAIVYRLDVDVFVVNVNSVIAVACVAVVLVLVVTNPLVEYHFVVRQFVVAAAAAAVAIAVAVAVAVVVAVAVAVAVAVVHPALLHFVKRHSLVEEW